MLTFDDGRGRGEKCQNVDYVICERPLILFSDKTWITLRQTKNYCEPCAIPKTHQLPAKFLVLDM